MLRLEEGTKAVLFARQIISDCIGHAERLTVALGSSFHGKQGVFVTLHTFPDHELRGCIGIPLPVMSLQEALVEASCGVTQDPRFPPLRGNELDAVVVEITVLTKPQRITVKQPGDYPKHIVIGQDGLLIEQGFYKGLLLPQVPVEQEWDVEEFLSNACMKAGLTPDAWLDTATKVSKFQGQIFSEKKPNGPVEEIQLHGSQH
jgi:uncharacterized protein (TIGR00296 family)